MAPTPAGFQGQPTTRLYASTVALGMARRRGLPAEAIQNFFGGLRVFEAGTDDVAFVAHRRTVSWAIGHGIDCLLPQLEMLDQISATHLYEAWTFSPNLSNSQTLLKPNPESR